MIKEKKLAGLITALIVLLLLVVPACTVVNSTEDAQLRANNDHVYSVHYYGFRPYWQNSYYAHPVDVRSLH